MDYLNVLTQLGQSTVGEVAELAFASNAHDLKRSSQIARQNIYRVHIEPWFGDRPIEDVSSLEIEAWAVELRTKLSTHTRRTLSTATVEMAMVRLGSVFNYAHRHGIIKSNPWSIIKVPRAAKPHQMFLDVHEVEALAAKLDRHYPYGLMVRTAAYTGLRTGELAALRVADVDLVKNHIEVRRTVVRRDGGWEFGSPKSERSVRDVPIPRALADQLACALAIHPYRNDAEARFWPGIDSGHTGIRGANNFDNQLDLMLVYRQSLRPAADELHLTGLTWRSLRHTYASLLAAAGVGIHKVSRWMGHENVAVTDEIYTHLFPKDRDVEMARFDSFLVAAVDGGAWLH